MDDIKLSEYAEFVDSVTSNPSKQYTALLHRLAELEMSGGHMEDNVNFARLLTSAIGLASEGGEFAEIVKKILFQEKPCDDEAEYHMKRELGDVLWYWVQGCMALNVDPEEVMKMNIEKLKSRYPGGKFDGWFSENRKDGDL